MSEDRFFRNLATWHRALLPVAVTMAATIFLLSIQEATKTGTRLPPQVGFIPVESRALAVSSSLDGIWQNLGNHTARLRDPAPESFWAEMNTSLHGLSQRCIALQTPEDLSSAGFDVNRGLSFALVNEWPDFLLSLPVRDDTLALDFLGTLFVEPIPVNIALPNAEEGVTRIVVTADRVENARVCEVPENAPFQSNPRLLSVGVDHDVTLSQDQTEISLFLVPDGRGPARMELSCRLVLEDGTSRPCDCRIDYSRRCDQPFVNDVSTPTLMQWDNARLPGPGNVTIWTSENEDMFAGFVDGYMLIATRPERVRTAADRRDERATRLLGDNALLGLIDQFHTEAEAGDATLMGLLRGIEEPVVGTVPFSITAGPDRIKLRAALPIDTFGFDVFENLVANSAAPAPALTDNVPFAALFNDPAIGLYLNLLDDIYTKYALQIADDLEDGGAVLAPDEITIIEPEPIEDRFGSGDDMDSDRKGADVSPDADDGPNLVTEDRSLGSEGPAATDCWSLGQASRNPSIYDTLGNFAPLVRGIMALDTVGPLEGYLLDLRDGVPEVVLVQHGLVPSRLERLIDRAREQMKEARDIQVLCLARAAYWEDQGRKTLPVVSDEFLELLGDEGPDLVERYTIQETDIVRKPEAAPYEFESAAYRDTLDRFEIGFVPPPVSDLDVRYRFARQGQDELDIEALRNNSFRLAFGRLVDGSVAFATDARTLERFLAILASRTAEAGRSTGDKLWVKGNPEHLVTLGLLYPVEEVRSYFSTGGFEVLDQYRSVRVSLLPSENFSGLSIDAELTHD